MAKDELTGKMENFALAVVKLGEYGAAYKEAYDCTRMKQATINRNASRLAATPKIAARINQLKNEAKAEVIYGVVEAMRDAVDLHTANANELVQVRRLNCRYCNGKDHEYQWRDPREFAEALARAIDLKGIQDKRRGPKTPQVQLPTNDGGYGFVRVAPPHPDCPRCDGEGTEDIKVADTRKLTGAARKLYAGAKVNKDGRIEILFRNQDAAHDRIMKALGMFTENVKLLPPGAAPDGVPALPADANEAARVYQAWVKGQG